MNSADYARKSSFFASAFQNLDETIVLLDASEKILFWNHMAECLFETPAEEAMGRPITDFLEMETSFDRDAGCKRNPPGGHHAVFETSISRRTGDDVRVQVKITPIKADDCGEGSMVTIRELETAVKREIDDLRSFPLESPMPVLRINSEGTVDFINATARAELNLKEGDRLKETWFDEIKGPDRVGAGQFEIRESDRIYRVNSKPSARSGCINLYCQDITDLRDAQETLSENEERFRHVVENINGIFYVIELPANRVAYVSPSFDQIFGRPSSVLEGDPHAFLQFIHAEDREYVEERIKRAATKRKMFSAEYRIVRPDGSVRWIWDRSFPIRNEKGVLHRVVGIGEDVTERRIAEQRLKVSQMKLMESEKLATLGKLSAGISHEINQPLTAIQSYAENARKFLDKNRPVDARQNLLTISDQVSRIKEIIENVRLLARHDPGRNQSIVVNEAIENVLSVIGGRVKLQNCRLIYDAKNGTVSAFGDMVRLEQTLLNILANALDAVAEQSDPEIVIDVEDGEDYAVIRVRDNGSGISTSIIDEVFEPFVTSKPEGKGTGLGLAISRSLIEGMGGILTAHIPEFRGAEFRISLRKASPSSASKDIGFLEVDDAHPEKRN